MREDRRIIRTRRALVDAFNHLVFNRRPLRVGDIVRQAKVGRSTFYDHYSGAEALHLEALRRPFGPLADAAAGKGDEALLTHILAHFWDYRQQARRSLGDKAERLLAQMVEERLAAAGRLRMPRPLAARQLASAALSPITAWLKGEATCTAEVLAHSICATGRAMTETLATGES
jgi:AcrR family transcriptional regulator